MTLTGHWFLNNQFGGGGVLLNKSVKMYKHKHDEIAIGYFVTL